MAGTVAVIVAISSLGLSILLSVMGGFDIYSLIILVALFNLLQWLIAPYIVNWTYRVRRVERGQMPELENMLEDLSQKTGIGTPKLMFSELPIPNAFAYGSFLTGSHVAVTRGLLRELETDQVEAVMAHEVGHIKHRDMHVMMLASFLPSLFYIISRSFLWRSYGNRDRDTRGMAIVGGVSLLLYMLLTMFNLGLSRLREYYADQHSVSIIDDGGRKLSEALARISQGTWRVQRGNAGRIADGSFKTLFISDPDRAGLDVAEIQRLRFGSTDSKLVDKIISRKVSAFDGFLELFSTHPNIVKRLRALQG